jgi:hypothetical protein
LIFATSWIDIICTHLCVPFFARIFSYKARENKTCIGNRSGYFYYLNFVCL